MYNINYQNSHEKKKNKQKMDINTSSKIHRLKKKKHKQMANKYIKRCST